jgi:predicted DNA-binding transcriptional regulator AlpA
MPIQMGNVDQDKLLTEIQAADLLRMSSRTLQAWRGQGVGPPFIRAGRAIRYRRSDVMSWATDNTVKPKPPSAHVDTGPEPPDSE